MLVAIIKKRLDLKADLYTILQVLSLSLFEKLSLKQILIGEEYTPQELERSIQQNLFDYLTDTSDIILKNRSLLMNILESDLLVHHQRYN